MSRSSVEWLGDEERTALVKDSTQWSDLAAQVKTFIVHDDATATIARDMAKKAREAFRGLEEKRKTITTPLLAAKNATDALFKPSLNAIAEIKRHYEQEIARYDLEREQARACVLVESTAQIAASIVPTTPIPEPVKVVGTSVRHHWEPTIVDPDLVPREFCSPDIAKIKAAIWYADTPHKEPQPIPGVSFEIKSTVVVR